MNTPNFREREFKYLLTEPVALEEVGEKLKLILKKSKVKIEKIVYCKTNDFYFPAPVNEIRRFRDSWGRNDKGYSEHLQEITIKRKDKPSIQNRFEYNFRFFAESSEDAYKLLEFMFGPPQGKLYKKEVIFFLEGHVVLSVTTINNLDAVYLEMEGPSLKSVKATNALIKPNFKMKMQTHSFFEQYIEVKLPPEAPNEEKPQ